MIEPAQTIIDTIADDVDELMTALEAADITAPAWRDQMAATLARGHLAAYMAGAGTADLETADQRRLLQTVAVQLDFLDRFVIEIQDAASFQRGWNARAAMYAEAVGGSWWTGKFRMWPLPSVPRDGSTQCLSRCNCRWEIVELEGEGNADCYWRLGPSESCQSCLERAAQWAPIRFRDGVLQ